MDKIKLFELLKIPRGITSVIGSGGKTTMLRILARELSRHAPVLLTTTTHFMPFPEYPLATDISQIDLLAENNPVIVYAQRMYEGKRRTEGKLRAPGDTYFVPLLRSFPYIIVEADGSKGLPLKLHAPYEPVIPMSSSKTVTVVGASGLKRPFKEVCHRAERLSAFPGLSDISPETSAIPSLVGKLLRLEGLSDTVFINQTDLVKDPEDIKLLADELSCCVYSGSLKDHAWQQIK